MTTINLIGAKGGVGTTVIAAALAVHAAERGHQVEVTGRRPDDVAGVLGSIVNMLDGDPTIRLGTPEAANTVEINDLGAWFPGIIIPDGTTFLVTRNCVLSLRRAMAVAVSYDGLLLVSEPNRTLDRTDVAAVIDKPVIEVDTWPAISRAVDAGLLGARLPAPMTKFVAAVLATAMVATA